VSDFGDRLNTPEALTAEMKEKGLDVASRTCFDVAVGYSAYDAGSLSVAGTKPLLLVSRIRYVDYILLYDR
jgi:hypothetical protein